MSTEHISDKTESTAHLLKEDILKLLSDGSTDENLFAQLKALNVAAEKAKQARKTAVVKLVENIESHEITLSELVEANAFTKEDLLSEAKAYFPQFGKAAKSSSSSTTKTNKVDRIAKATGEALIKIVVPNAKGPRTSIRKDSEKPTIFGAGFQHLKSMSGNLKENFLSFAVYPEALAWMKDAVQEEWLNSWVGYVSRGGKKA